MNERVKKQVILHLPYVLIALMATKIPQAIRLTNAKEATQIFMRLLDGFEKALENPLPSMHPNDLAIGVTIAVTIRIIVYFRGKNAKKFRKGTEYGSARWGNPKDIAPYKDRKFENNVILTQTEHLTMNSRPKDPKTARNKNVLIIGGSGSGKTRFWLKPNLMQCHSSYVVTDPKGYTIIRRRYFEVQKEGVYEE